MTNQSKTMAAADAADFAAPAAGVFENGTTSPGDQGRHASALQFLTALFGTKPAELYILIWLLGTKSSKWFRDVAAAAQFVVRHHYEDTYFGTALAPADFGPGRRCKAEDTAGIVAFYIDLDHQSPGHKKQNLPPTLEDARNLIPSDLPPSAVVNSGHGVQAWWILSEPWIFHTPDERIEAARLAEGFNALFKARAAEKHWDVDSVFDQARVMRVPGTTNNKVSTDPRPVDLAELNGRRYTPEEIRCYLSRAGIGSPLFAPAPKPMPGDCCGERGTSPGSSANAASVHAGDLVLNPAAEPPFEKFDMLADIEPRFRQSWERKRPDMQDQSPSAYDLSLATHSARVRWTDQEIADLLIAHRRKHRDDLKLRVDYFKRTIEKARAAAEEFLRDQDADESLSRLLGESPEPAEPAQTAAPSAAGPSGVPQQTTPDKHAERRRTILTTLSTKFRVPLKRIVKFTGDDPQFRLETELGDVQLGNVNGLICESRLRSSIAAVTGKYLPHFEFKHWTQIAQLLLDACEEVDRGRDTTLAGRMTEWLRGYMRDKSPHETIEEADEDREPFTRGGRVYIFSDSFRRWLAVQLGEKVTRNPLTADLRAFGAAPKVFDLNLGGRATTRSAWGLPAGLWDPGVDAGAAVEAADLGGADIPEVGAEAGTETAPV
jgi:hypothetical protein